MEMPWGVGWNQYAVTIWHGVFLVAVQLYISPTWGEKLL